MFTLEQLKAAIMVAHVSSYLSVSFTTMIAAGGAVTDVISSEIPAIEWAITYNEETGEGALSVTGGNHPFTLDPSEPIDGPANILKIAGAGIVLSEWVREA
ncbi:TPA: hypothetical protein JLH60_004762 [Escherichia coli]|nr:hypothetical protein [Escherichia coli]